MKLDWTTRRLTLREPLRISRAAMSERDAVWVRIIDGDDVGYGEVVTSPRLGLTVETIERALAEAEYWLSETPDPEHLLERLPELRLRLRQALPVVCAVDVAVHDLLASRTGLPLDMFLGVPHWDSVPTAYTLGITSARAAAATAARLVDAGFSVLKVKLGSAFPAEDIARVRAVRAVAPTATLLLDPNGAWDAAIAIEVLSTLADCDIAAVEQPVPAGRLDELATVARAVPMPIIADEDAGALEDLSALPAEIAGINIKLAECGGLDVALHMIDWAARSDIGVMFGCQASTSLSIAAAAHLTGAARWVDLDGHLLIADDPWQGLGGGDGVLRRPPGTGLGVRRGGVG